MKLGTKEHYDLMEAFERDHGGLRLDRENKDVWSKGRVYQNGEANSLFLAFRKGYSYCEAVNRDPPAIESLSAQGEAEAVEDPRWQKLRDLFGLDGWHDGVWNGIPNPDQIVTHIEYIADERARLLKESIDAQPSAQVAVPDAVEGDSLHQFKNFHRLLCERFGYCHDEKDWQRDQVSLIEHIAALASNKPVGDGIAAIAAERRRQIVEEGWTAEHDDAAHHDGELARAAAAYVLSGMKYYQLPIDLVRKRKSIIADIWPWGPEWFKPRGKPDAVIRSLVKAGALIAAEIDQQQRRLAASGEPSR